LKTLLSENKFDEISAVKAQKTQKSLKKPHISMNLKH
jgi:hypothetical protein